MPENPLDRIAREQYGCRLPEGLADAILRHAWPDTAAAMSLLGEVIRLARTPRIIRHDITASRASAARCCRCGDRLPLTSDLGAQCSRCGHRIGGDDD